MLTRERGVAQWGIKMENLYDIVLDKLKDRQSNVRLVLQKRFEHTNPFRQEKLGKEMLIKTYDNMSEQDWYTALDKFGKDKVDAFRQRVETLKGGIQ